MLKAYNACLMQSRTTVTNGDSNSILTVITFGETTQMNNRRKETRSWHIKGKDISEKHSWEHIDMLLNGNFSTFERSTEVVKKGKTVVYSLMGAGIRPGGLNPICGATVWRTFGTPALLFGCEVWSNLSKLRTRF